MKKFDVVIIGSGPGGYVAAIRCAQLGFNTALIEKYNTLGGTCLNVGCIPSKALLDSSHHYDDAQKHFDKHGIDVKNISLNFKQMIDRKNEVVAQTTGGINYLMDKNKITVFNGFGSFKDPTHINIAQADGTTETIEATKTIIATGSKPASLPFITIDKKRVITSTEALNLTEVPKHLIIIGGGVIGLELGQVYLRLGAQVSVVEFMPTIIPTMDAMLAHKAEEEGVLVAEIMAGQKPHINYNLIPGVVYTWPEVASVGQTEAQLKASGIAYKVGAFPMRALGRARASMDIDGQVKILADATTDEILGVHMIGARAADMIAEAVTAMEFRASAEDISRMSHAHPTYTEAIKEAALAATENRAIHV